MNEYIAIADIQPVIDRKRSMPTILMWNRLEGRPRTTNFDRALRAEVRDALFMITRQLQLGEFKGDDAGSPVVAKVRVDTTRIRKYRASDHATQLLETGVPLEAKVEQRLLPFRMANQDLSLDMRLLMGRQWLKMIGGEPELKDLGESFVEGCSIRRPDASRPADAQVCAHQTAWQQYAAVAGRAIDGAVLYLHLKAGAGNHAYDLLPEGVREGLELNERDLIDEKGRRFVAWFEKLFYQPTAEDEDAWLSPKLEYQFACSAPKVGAEKVFTANEYYHGHLDWYNLNVDSSKRTLGDPGAAGGEAAESAEKRVCSLIPTQVQFDGMPNTRWWTFEEGKTNFGDVKPDTTDLNKLLFIEFGLVYANDWFLVPFTLPLGTATDVRGLAITNVFGERLWVMPAGAGSEDNWQRWSMYGLHVDGKETQMDLSLLLLPTAVKIQESQPIEEVYLVRDEMANMVWGVETKIPLPTGVPKPGREAAIELHDYYQRLADAAGAATLVVEGDAEQKANIKYQIMSSVPENWIPFIPVHAKDSNREIQLQRAAMPRIIVGDAEIPKRIRPRTQLLRCGLDQRPRTAYKVFEEEVPRAGVRVYQCFRRTRWLKGRVFNWLGVGKQTGHGEGSSGLRFDWLADTKS